MTEPIACLRCGAPLQGGACPRCLLAAGLESGAPGAPTSSAPSPADMQKHFPGLEILELLGQGGMGIVYKARQRNLDRFVALKVLLPEIAREPGFAERFTREARTLGRLQHPRIVGVHDFGESDGLWYLLMEYVDGTNLRQVMKAGGLGPKEALAIVPQVCDALQYAHDQGIVHRDIKPENILVDRAGRVKIADFGLAKILQRAPVELNITRTGQVMGTLHYMAPEQYKAPEGVDHRADIYSLGVVFYEMLTGELPVGSFPRPSSRAGVDARLDGVVLRALERERDQRWQKASEVRTAVDGISSGPGAPPTVAAAPAPAAAPAAPAAAFAPPLEVHPWAFRGGLGIPAAIAAGLVGWLLVIPFAHAGAAFWTAAVLSSLTAFAGWIASFVGWVQIHRFPLRWRGLGWAITGALLPPALFCSGGFLVPMFALTGTPGGGPIQVTDGPGGTRVNLPGISVEDGPGGTRVRLPGISIEDRGHGRSPVIGGTSGALLPAEFEGGPADLDGSDRADILRALDRAWDEYAVEAGPGASDERLQALYTREDRDVLRSMTPQELYRQRKDRRLGGAYLSVTDFAGSPLQEMRLVRVILDGDGTGCRAVRTDGRLVVSYPAEEDGNRWKFRVGPVDRTYVAGGPAAATPKWRADAVRGLDRLWAATGTGILKVYFPGTDLAEHASLFQMYALALRPNSTSGRMVWTDGAVTIALACRYADGKWEVLHQSVQKADRAPTAEDRDGWLGETPEPEESDEASLALARKVTGGQPDMTDADRAALARKLDLYWKTSEGAAFIQKFRYMFVDRKPYVAALAAPVENLALYAVALDGTGTKARVVRSNGELTISYDVSQAGNWTFSDTVHSEFQERGATEADRDGWLLR